MWYGKVKSIEPVKRSDITEILKDSDEIYYRFEIEEWIKLPRKIEVAGYQVRSFSYTSLYLLTHAETVSETCIKDKEEFRLWKELKRYDRNLNVDEAGKVKSFVLGNTAYVINGDTIRAINDGEDKTIMKKDFEKSPVKSLKKLL